MDWLIPASIGTLVCGGLAVLGILAKHGFNTIVKTLDEHGADLKAVRSAIPHCVTWDDLGKELDPMKADVRDHERRITVVETMCKERQEKAG